MIDHDKIGIILAKYVAGELTLEERAELEWAMEADPRVKDMLLVILGLKEIPPAGMSAGEEHAMLERGLRRFADLTGKRSDGQSIRRFEEQSDRRIEEQSGKRFESQPVRRSDERSVSQYEGQHTLRDDEEHIEAVREAVDSHEIAPSDGIRAIAENGQIEGDGESRGPRRITLYRRMAAASVIALLAAGAAIYMRHGHKQGAVIHPEEVATKYGTRTFVELPDSSKLWLNAGSKVTYAEGFAGGKRELTLSGEGYFDIRHDPKNPFIIHTGRLDVRVLGTSVDVKAYPGDSTVETTLIMGRAQIELVGDNRSGIGGQDAAAIVLQPNEKVIIRTNDIPDHAVDRPSGSVAVGADKLKFTRHAVMPDPAYKTIIETSWVEDKLVFRNLPFEEVAMRLERWYNIRFRFENDKYSKDSLTGYFKDQPIRNVMDALQLTLGFHYEISGDTIRIW